MTKELKVKELKEWHFNARRFFIDELRVLKHGGYCSPAYGLSDICDSSSLCQWFRLEIRFTDFRRLTIPQKQSITY